VFDYTEPFANHTPERRARLEATAERAAARGEPWLSFFDPAEIVAILRDKGFRDIENAEVAGLVATYAPRLAEDIQSGPGGHVIRASR
jgi:O-methyltransferase involved in polyketide biosynthesis